MNDPLNSGLGAKQTKKNPKKLPDLSSTEYLHIPKNWNKHMPAQHKDGWNDYQIAVSFIMSGLTPDKRLRSGMNKHG